MYIYLIKNEKKKSIYASKFNFNASFSHINIATNFKCIHRDIQFEHHRCVLKGEGNALSIAHRHVSASLEAALFVSLGLLLHQLEPPWRPDGAVRGDRGLERAVQSQVLADQARDEDLWPLLPLHHHFLRSVHLKRNRGMSRPLRLRLRRNALT